MPQFLETPRTFSRPFTPTDAAKAFGWFSDPEVMRYIPNGGDHTEEDSVRRITRYVDHQNKFGFSKWIILDRATGMPIGDAGLIHLPDSQRVELGYRLARDWSGKGLASEVGAAWRDVAKPWFGLTRLYAFAHPDNAASLHVMMKLGFAYSHQETFYGLHAPVYAIDLEPRTGKLPT